MKPHARPRRITAHAAATLLAMLCACEKPSPASTPAPTPDGDGPAVARHLAVPATHPLRDRFEGTQGPNDCSADADCHAAGCSQEVCSADAGVVTTCEVLPVSLPQGTACGCVTGQCQWWNAEGATLPLPPAPEPEPEPKPEPKPKPSCGTVRCEAPKVCVEYYGIAGPSGPKLASCEIQCDPVKKKGSCPEGTQCVTIADGPGSVCR